MGKATRWIKGLLGMKKEKEKENETENVVENKKRFSFGKYGKESNIGGGSENIPVNIPARDMAWLKSYMNDSEKEQNKHAIAVAAATAAAADAAVAAAQAAVAVVRLTSKGNNALAFNGGRERWAAVKIQTVFRGYLARKALRALKGLVKIQALVRGYLVRKRAAATLHSMQALIRAQTAVRSQRARRSFKENWIQSEFRHRKSIERFDETRSEIHSKRISVSTNLESSIHGGGFDESPKIVEIDTFMPRSRSRRYTYNYNAPLSESGDDYSSYQAISSPLLCPKSARITIPTSQNLNDYDWCFTADELKFPTAQSTPRFANSVGYNAPPTPAKSVCGDGYFRPYSNCPSYMANTQSFKAKLRSLSAPKQRPEPGSGPKKKLSLNEIMAARNSISSVRMQRPSSIHVQDGLNL